MAKVNSAPVTFSAKRSCVAIVIAGIVIFILALQVIQPIKLNIADRYTDRGDSYFLSHDFERAEQEYAKALKYNPEHALAEQRKEVATKAAVDMLQARSTFEQLQDTDSIALIDEANQTFQSAPDALQSGLRFYQTAQYNLARYPLAQAVELDPGYPEAWHYLYLTYSKLGALDAGLAAGAQAAQAQRDLLSPRWR